MRRVIPICLFCALIMTSIWLSSTMADSAVLAQEPAPPRPTLSLPPRPPHTPAPATPTPLQTDTAQANDPGSPRSVCLRLEDRTAATEAPSTLHFRLTLTNRSSEASLRNLILRLPLPQADSLVVHTSTPQLWVSDITAQTVTFRLHTLLPGHYVTATVQLQRVHVQVVLNEALRAVAEWPTHKENATLLSNVVVTRNDYSESDVTGAQIDLLRIPASSSVTLAGTGFASFEQVSIWANLENDQNIPIATLFADARGEFGTSIQLQAFSARAEALVVQGVCSDVTRQVLLSSYSGERDS